MVLLTIWPHPFDGSSTPGEEEVTLPIRPGGITVDSLKGLTSFSDPPQLAVAFGGPPLPVSPLFISFTNTGRAIILNNFPNFKFRIRGLPVALHMSTGVPFNWFVAATSLKCRVGGIPVARMLDPVIVGEIVVNGSDKCRSA